MAIYLGIDGGGTKTAVSVGDEWCVLGRGVSGGSNVVRLGEEKALASLREAILSACEAANVKPDQVVSTCMGVAGASVPEFRMSLQRLISSIVPGEVQVIGDNVIAMEAAFGAGPGVIVISGTGSICFGRNERGETTRAGGWGHAISDEGSGHWIGKQAVIAAMRAHDRGRETRLMQDILGGWEIATMQDLVRVANGTPPPDFSKLFPLVAEAAEAGDAVAGEVLKRAGSELGELALIVISRLWNENEPAKVAMVGGAFANSRHVRDAFAGQILHARRNAEVNLSVVEPVAGALALARKNGK